MCVGAIRIITIRIALRRLVLLLAGGEGLDALEGASALGVKACFRYLGSTARVGPLLEVLPTSEKRSAWLVLFGNESVPLPE